jgi:hypothetical protein
MFSRNLVRTNFAEDSFYEAGSTPELSGVVLPPVVTTSDSSIVVPPGLMLALSLAQRFSSVEALVKVWV